MRLLALALLLLNSLSGEAGTVKSAPTRIVVQSAQSGNLPTWRVGLNIGDWKEIPSTSMSLLKPTYAMPGNGQYTIIEAWNGLAIDPRDSTIYSVANGGHSDWAGNEVNIIRMGDNAPRWTEKLASTPPNLVEASQYYYKDGRPTSRHSFYGVTFNTSRNRVMLQTGYWWAPAASLIPTMDGYNISTNAYDPKGTFPNVPSAISGAPGAPFTVDPSTDDIYAFGGNGVFRWSNSTNNWSTLVTNSNIGVYSAAAALDSKRKRILVCGGDHPYVPAPCHVFDIATNTVSVPALNGLASSSIDSRQGSAMFYVPALDAYIYRRSGISGNSVIKIDAASFTISQMQVQGGANAAAPANDLWARWLYAPQLGGAFYLPTFNSNIWFVRLH